MKLAKISDAHPVEFAEHSLADHDRGYARVGKRAFDIALALVLLPLVAPVILTLCAIVRRDGGPSLFAHSRIGLGGRRFNCWKIRSMVADAEKKLKAHLEAHPTAAAEWARDFKLENDPRITRFGQFIRKTSLDELPQVWNVLRGDMSFVGPRPIVDEELSRYGTMRQAYLSMRPGITGPWQVLGRNDISYAERVQLDADYARSLGFWTDVQLIARTAGVVLRRTGR
ncbi:sugar transferase [Vannielia sp.]|uniref:sugar transferase n=1 Tax=Vannielia sp. TaxID=2813045 RepID=UPI003BAABD7C